MNRYYILFLMVLSLIVSSCKNTNETAPNDYCYISTITLGTVKRVTRTYDRDGNVIKTTHTTLTGSNFPMTIDRVNRLITNRDSLPYGCNVDAILLNISYQGSVVAYRKAGTEDAWTAYRSSDSIDVRQPLELYTLATDGNSYRIDTLRVNVHQQEGDSLYWSKYDTEVDKFAGMTDLKAFMQDNKVNVLCKSTSDVTLVTRNDLNTKEAEWNTQITNLPVTTDLQSLCIKDNSFYVSDENGHIYSSADAQNWATVGSQQPTPFTLITKSDNYFYALSGGKLMRSDDGNVWLTERLDDTTDKLPATDIRALKLTQTNENERIVMVGKTTTGDNVEVWNKMWNQYEAENEAEWMYIPLSADNRIPCPCLQYFNMLPYDGRILAFGGASLDSSRKALGAMYFSNDYGITWRADNELHLPYALEGVEGPITATVDNNHFIWLIADKQVWRGRINRLGFAR